MGEESFEHHLFCPCCFDCVNQQEYLLPQDLTQIHAAKYDGLENASPFKELNMAILGMCV